jgi:eukaryotic-like serine/threonine-protein kinase
VQKFDTPLEQATAASLEALKAYTDGLRAVQIGDLAKGITLYRHAVELDPQFALAYAEMAAAYSSLGEDSLATQNSQRAFELRERASERERFVVDYFYYSVATGNLQEAQRTSELWAATYPRDGWPQVGLGWVYESLGDFQKAEEATRQAVLLEPDNPVNRDTLAVLLLSLGRLDQAAGVIADTRQRTPDVPLLIEAAYKLAFVRGDSAGMQREAARAVGQPGVEDTLLSAQSDTEAFYGRLARAREFSQRAVESAQRFNLKEEAARWEANAALREALFGNTAEAKQRAGIALGSSKGRDVQFAGALALALAGDLARPPALAEDLGKRFPEDTIIQFNYLPTLHGQLALSRNGGPNAIEVLRAAAPYELGDVGTGTLYPVFIRGEAYLVGHQASEAAAEFQKILDHSGIVVNEPIGALARLQLGRAYAMQGDTTKAKAAYQEFLALWKDADPDIPILKQAKAEYTKLQ